jgi:membrane protease YdiL (CAAX protease family)
MQAMLYLFAAAICVPVFSWFWKKSFGSGVHWNGLAASSRAVGFIGFGIVLSIAVTVVSKLIKIPDSAPILDLFKSPTLAWIATIFGALIAPGAEEIAFRGFLLPVLKRYTGRILAVALTSAIFALMHASQIGHAWGAVAVLFFVSVVLCEVRLRFNSVAASTIVHMAYNSTLFIALIVATGGYRHFDKIPH